jgi:Tol biopolymer transport system component
VAVTTTAEIAGGIDVLSIDGLAARRVVSGPSFSWPLTASGDDILYAPENTGSRFIGDLFRASLSGQGEASPLATTKADEYLAQFSPDGKFVAYTSDETGRIEVFVMAYPAGGRWQVSQNGGTQPRWNRNGRELIFVDPQNFLVSVDVESVEGSFQTGEAKQLFQFHGAAGVWRYDISPDGTRFLVTAPLEEDLASPVLVITDWTRKLGSR